MIRCLLKDSKKSVSVNKIHKAIYSFCLFGLFLFGRRRMPAVRFNILCGREHWVMKEKKLVPSCRNVSVPNQLVYLHGCSVNSLFKDITGLPQTDRMKKYIAEVRLLYPQTVLNNISVLKNTHVNIFEEVPLVFTKLKTPL